jgi:hypothetical protein
VIDPNEEIDDASPMALESLINSPGVGLQFLPSP